MTFRLHPIRPALAALPLALLACSGGGGARTRDAGAPSTDAASAAPAGGRPFRVVPRGRFDDPFAMAFLADGRLLMTEKAGRLRLRQANGRVVTVAGAPSVAVGGQGGLLDVALAPDFTQSGVVYLSFSEPRPGGGSLALARARLVETDGAARLDAPAVIWRAGSDGQGGQFGAVIAFAPDGGSLFLASGERQRFTPAQDPDQALGKVLRLTLDGKPWPGNPQAGRLGAGTVAVTDPPADTAAARTAPVRRLPARRPNTTPAETWSTGHRNPYGLAFDAGGRLWEVEMGPRGGDEVNLILPGRNYGWPLASNGDNYDGLPIPDHRPGDGFEAPRVWWNPSISPGGMIIYSGNSFPQWRGSMLIGALGAQALIRVSLGGDRAAKADQWDMGARVRDVAQAPDGTVWLLEDEGPLVELVPAQAG